MRRALGSNEFGGGLESFLRRHMCLLYNSTEERASPGIFGLKKHTHQALIHC